MSPHQTVAIGVRIFAVWVAITVLKKNWASFEVFQESTAPGYAFSLSLLLLSSLMVAALWLFPKTIARKLLAPEGPKPEPSASPNLWLAMGCALLGLSLLTSALPSLVFDTYTLVRISLGSMEPGNMRANVVYFLIEVGIGLWL